MNITILDNRDVIVDEMFNIGTQNENNASILNFNFPENLATANKKIVFITPDGIFSDLITNNSYKITNAVTKYKSVSVYVWLVDIENDIDFRSKIWELDFNFNEKVESEISQPEKIDILETIIVQLNTATEKIEDLENRVSELESKND